MVIHVKDTSDYFKRLTPAEFMKASFPTISFLMILYFLFIPAFEIFLWFIRRPEPFDLFPTRMELAFSCVVVTFFVTRDYKTWQGLYRRMQEVPFLIMEEEEILMDRAMLIFPKGKEWAGKIRLKWSSIQRIEVKSSEFFIFFQENGQQKSEKVDLKWVKEKEDLLKNLKSKCEKHQIKWIENS